ncbi:hypothetical protein K8352_18630 [Flavobacteriaceae bacterium F89]|uniref:Uncharacterized protein n=1 Tax=Cerina litoralis TaxID=2874477 RepID=A0AAE3F018_9FLAO|nr:hypothetical protein [Cerina litoralis]MCG2462786.1 hypothetical protein [Cerina litoralis]
MGYYNTPYFGGMRFPEETYDKEQIMTKIREFNFIDQFVDHKFKVYRWFFTKERIGCRTNEQVAPNL